MNPKPQREGEIEKILDRFDGRIIALRKKAKEFPSRAMEGLLPIFEKDHEETKEYFRKELSSLMREEYEKGWNSAVKSKNQTISILMKELEELKKSKHSKHCILLACKGECKK